MKKFWQENLKLLKKLFGLIPVLLVVFGCVGCGANQANEWNGSEEIMTLQIGNDRFEVDLVANATVEALLKMLPLNLDMSELNGNEKYCYLDTGLPTAAKKVGQIKAGDIMLWGDNCLVIFYQSFSTSYAYTQIGHIKDTTNLLTAVGTGNVQVQWMM